MRLNSVAYRYHRRAAWVLHDVTLALPPGRIVEVTGHNGAGKSTLLRLLAGILRPHRGELIDRPGRVGYAPERFPADQAFTVRDYLRHMARMRRVPAEHIQTWTERLRFTELLDVRLPELSKGSAHKVGLAQALLGDPGLLVLDEPFAGLDPETRAELPTLLAGLKARGTIVVVSDHQGCLRDLPDVERLEVAGHTVGQATGARTARDLVEQALIEVVVPADEAPTVLAKLRADGYDVRGPRPC